MDIQSLFGLNGRIALVTGGSRGIGKMFVEGLLAAGCAKVYISARKIDQMQETIAEFGEDKVIGIPADLSQMDGIQTLADEMAAREDKLDILINNAGAAWGQPYLEFNEAGWHRTMDLNVKTPFFLTQKLHDLLVAGGSGDHLAKVIHVSSI
ncbi:MAG: SDR family NAD(P)-dependent oxidoreductase, partial [Marinomonas sp.]